MGGLCQYLEGLPNPAPDPLFLGELFRLRSMRAARPSCIISSRERAGSIRWGHQLTDSRVVRHRIYCGGWCARSMIGTDEYQQESKV